MSDFFHDFLGVALIVVMAVGFIFGLLACPIRLITTPLRWLGKGLIIGIFVPLIGNFIGALIGLFSGIFVIFVAPAIITVSFFKRQG